MGSKRSASSSANKEAKIQGQKADNEARKKLGIVETKTAYSAMGGSMGKTTGYESTSGNQMYGAAYNEARGEYLSSQGLATARKVTDAMGKERTVYDPRTADGTYTDLSRQAAEEARRNKTPLSKEMFASQKKFQKALAGGLFLLGTPIIPGILNLKSNAPYSDYVSQKEKEGFYSSEGLSNKIRIKNNSGGGGPIVSNNEKNTDDTKLKSKNKYAGIGASSIAKGRSFLG